MMDTYFDGAKLSPPKSRVDELLITCMSLLRQYADEAGPCDHAANICICGLKHTIFDLEEHLGVRHSANSVPTHDSQEEPNEA